MRARLPGAITPEWQLTQSPNATAALTPLLLTPRRALLAPSTASALDAYSAAGGVVVELAAHARDGWNASAARAALGSALLKELRAQLGVPPVQLVQSAAAGGYADTGVHAVPYVASGALIVLVSNNFTECNLPDGTLPPVARGWEVRIASPKLKPLRATDVVSGAALHVREHGASGWAVELSEFQTMSAVLIETTPS